MITDHNDLATRIERADGPDRALDAEIAALVGAKHGPDGGFCDNESGDYWAVDECAPRYTSSIDAAMQLVAKGREWSVDAYNSNGVYPEHVRASAWVQGSERVFAATPAIALCAVALRAQVQP